MKDEPYITAETIAERTGIWLSKIARVNRRRADFRIRETALLVIDMQDFFLNPESHAYISAAHAIIDPLERLVLAFRKVESQVIFTVHSHHPENDDAEIMGYWWNDLCLDGSRGCEIIGRLAPLPGEKTIRKNRYSAFFNTDLEVYLKNNGIKSLVVTGVMTNLCCESTARDAFFRNFRVFMPADCLAAKTEEMHIASLLNLAYGFAFVTDSGWIIEQIQHFLPK